MPYAFLPPELKDVELGSDSINLIRDMAHDFWERVTNDVRISDEFKAFLELSNPIDLARPDS